MKTRDLENTIAGLFLALFMALPDRAGDTALDTLFTLASHGASEYEAKFYRDLASSIVELRTPLRARYEQQEFPLH